jgi:hypothetical protein
MRLPSGLPGLFAASILVLKPAYAKVTIIPASISLASGESIQFKATDDRGQFVPVTWELRTSKGSRPLAMDLAYFNPATAVLTAGQGNQHRIFILRARATSSKARNDFTEAKITVRPGPSSLHAPVQTRKGESSPRHEASAASAAAGGAAAATGGSAISPEREAAEAIGPLRLRVLGQPLASPPEGLPPVVGFGLFVRASWRPQWADHGQWLHVGEPFAWRTWEIFGERQVRLRPSKPLTTCRIERRNPS